MLFGMLSWLWDVCVTLGLRTGGREKHKMCGPKTAGRRACHSPQKCLAGLVGRVGKHMATAIGHREGTNVPGKRNVEEGSHKQPMQT